MNLHNDLKDNHGQLEHLHTHTHTHTLVTHKNFHIYYHLPSTIHKSII